MQTSQIKSWSELSVKDLYNFLKLRADIFVVDQECPYQDLDGLDQKSQHFWKEQDNEIVAYLRVIVLDDMYKIGRVCTHAKYRNNGLASELMDSAMQWIKKDNQHSKIQLSAQEHLVDFYKRWHFESKGKIYLDVGIPHQDMYFEI